MIGKVKAKGPSIALVRPNWKNALKVWENWEKMQKTPWGFEPPLMWTQRREEHALDHLATWKTYKFCSHFLLMN